MRVQNPVISGFYPDPSICRVGEDYYIVVSSFAYFPGIPIFHSKDLAHWHNIGHVLTEDNWMDFTGLQLSDGVWAPTIRHINGRFFVVYSVSHGPDGMKTYVVTADDVRGPWSAPKQLDVEGFDPSLFQDDDGRVWLTACKDRSPRVEGEPGCLWLREFDPDACAVISDEIDMWSGALRNAWVEAPRIFKHEGTYWLVAAEGGTERGHAVTLASAQKIEGPYVGHDRNPVLTHRHLDPDWPIQNVGHLDIVEDSQGNSWGVVLGVRPIRGHHTLGRETFLVPMKWAERGPVFAPETGRVEIELELPDSEPQAGYQTPNGTCCGADAKQMEVQHEWITPWRSTQFSRTECSITISAEHGQEEGTLHNAVMRRQTDQAFAFTCALPAAREGVSTSAFIMQNPQRRVEVRSTAREVTVRVFDGDRVEDQTICVFGSEKADEVAGATVDVAAVEPVRVLISCEPGEYNYLIETSIGSEWKQNKMLPRDFLSTESSGGFVGVVMGIDVEVSQAQPVTFEEVRYARLNN